MIYTIDDVLNIDELERSNTRDAYVGELRILNEKKIKLENHIDEYLIYNKLVENLNEQEKVFLYEYYKNEIKLDKEFKDLNDDDFFSLQVASGYNYEYICTRIIQIEDLNEQHATRYYSLKAFNDATVQINKYLDKLDDLNGDILNLEKEKETSDDIGLVEYKIERKEEDIKDVEKDIRLNIRRLREIYPNVLSIDANELSGENKDLIYKFIEMNNFETNPIRIVINSDVNYVLTKKMLEDIDELKLYLDERVKGAKIFFKEKRSALTKKDLNYLWSYEDVITANKRIDEVVDNYKKIIKENELSPFEIMLLIHKDLSQYLYKEDSGDIDIGRNLVSIYKDNYIVCSGFVSYVQTILDKLSVKGLSSELIGAAVYTNEYYNHGSHVLNLISIDDDKYDIHGKYLEDVTLDSREEDTFKKGKGFARCLYPAIDSQFISDKKMRVYKHDDYKYGKARYALLNNHRSISYDNNIINTKLTNDKRIGACGEPITFNKYKKALGVLFDKKYVNESLKNSVYCASKEFKKEAKNSFNIRNIKDERVIKYYIGNLKYDIKFGFDKLKNLVDAIAHTEVFKK